MLVFRVGAGFWRAEGLPSVRFAPLGRSWRRRAGACAWLTWSCPDRPKHLGCCLTRAVLAARLGSVGCSGGGMPPPPLSVFA